MRLFPVRSALRLGLVLAACAAPTLPAPATAETADCRRCDRRFEDAGTLRVSFAAPSGGTVLVDRIVILTEDGAFDATPPERAEATLENRLDVRGFVGDLGGLERLFDRPLLAYVDRSRRVGPVYYADRILIADLRDAGYDAGALSVEAGAAAILTRARSPRRLVGFRLELDFAPVARGADARFDGASRVGDAYLTPSGLLFAPPPSALPGG